jgi:hypothetical protein
MSELFNQAFLCNKLEKSIYSAELSSQDLNNPLTLPSLLNNQLNKQEGSNFLTF